MSLIKFQIKLKLNKNNKHDEMMGRAMGAVRDPYNDLYLLFKSLEISGQRMSMKVQVSSTTVQFLRKKDQTQILQEKNSVWLD